MELNKGCCFCCESTMAIKENQNKYLGSSVYPGCQICNAGVWVNNSNKDHRYWIGSNNCCVLCKYCCDCCFSCICCCCTGGCCSCLCCKCCQIKYYSVPIWDGTKSKMVSNLDMAKTWLKYTFGCCGKFFMVLNYPQGASEVDKLNTTTGAIMYYQFVGLAEEKKFNMKYNNY